MCYFYVVVGSLKTSPAIRVYITPINTKHFCASCLLDAITRRFADEGAFTTSGSGASKAFPF
jgi:hypothetical protein